MIYFVISFICNLILAWAGNCLNHPYVILKDRFLETNQPKITPTELYICFLNMQNTLDSRCERFRGATCALVAYFVGFVCLIYSILLNEKQ